MASDLLFDVSAIDLTQVAMGADEVGRINPQTGPMRQIDHVVWFNAECTRSLGVKFVRPDEFWVPHHIPGRPLMPGVMMIEAAAQLCSLTYRRKTSGGEAGFIGFTRCDDVVFRGQVQPGDTLYLLTEEVSHRQRRFTSRTQGVLNGKLVFEATITGMVM